MPFPACLAAMQSPIYPEFWYQNALSVWLPNLLLAAAVTILLLGRILRNIPAESEDAAIMDGCGFWRTLTHLVIPRLGPALLFALAVLILASWEDVMAPRTIVFPAQTALLTTPGKVSVAVMSATSTLQRSVVLIGHTPVDAGAAAAIFMLAACVVIAFIYLLVRYLRLGRFTLPTQ